MARFSGPQYRGAMRVYRQDARARAEARQAAERARDAARETGRRRARLIWNSRAGRAWKAHTTHVDAKMAERRRAR